MRTVYYIFLFSSITCIGLSESTSFADEKTFVTDVFKIFIDNGNLKYNTVEIKISNSDKDSQDDETMTLDLNKGVYKLSSVVKRPKSALPDLRSVIVGNHLNAYQQLNNKYANWIQDEDVIGIGNRFHSILSQIQIATSPQVRGLSNALNGYIHLYTNTGQLDQLPLYLESAEELKSKNGFSISTAEQKAHCSVNSYGLITHLDLEVPAMNSYHYTLDVKFPPDSPIEFPPSPIFANDSNKLFLQIKKPIYGFAVNVISGVPTIVYAFPLSSYVKAGGQIGDKVLKIDDINLQNMTNSEIVNLLSPKGQVSITVLQGDTIKILNVKKTVPSAE